VASVSNPFVALFNDPVGTLTAAAYALGLVGVLAATWWAAVPNALYLYDNWRDGWLVLVPGRYVLRILALVFIGMADLWIIAAVIALLT